MPHPGTHITIVQRLALQDPSFAAVLGSPNPNVNAGNVESVRKARFAALGAVGPDLFYFMADYTAAMQADENTLVKMAGILTAIGDVSAAINEIVGKLEVGVDELTCGASEILFTLIGEGGLGTTAQMLMGSLIAGTAVFLKEESGWNPWSIMELRRQRGDDRTKWFWADYFHYVHTGDFATRLIQKAKTDPKYAGNGKILAYALGYMTHFVTDVVGHPYVNQVVRAPYRTFWQRHALVENFIDGYVWDRWHSSAVGQEDGWGMPVLNPSTQEPPLDQVLSKPNTMGTGGSMLHARLNDLINCGSAGSDDPVENFLSSAADWARGSTETLLGIKSISAESDTDFVLLTHFLAEAIQEQYGSMQHPLNLVDPKKPAGPGNNGLPTPEDINGAYGVARLLLRLMSESTIQKPEIPPNILDDLSGLLGDLMHDLGNIVSSIPSPPSVDLGGSFSFSSFWHALKKWAQYVADAAVAVVNAVIDLIKHLCQNVGKVGRDTVKLLFYALNSSLFSVYESFRSVLVYSGYAQPLPSELHDHMELFRSPGNPADTTYPAEEIFNNGDLPQTDCFSNYTPVAVPSGVNAEQPNIHWVAPYTAGSMPDALLDNPIKDNMFKAGTIQRPLADPGQTGDVLSAPRFLFTEQPFDFGGAMPNCTVALKDTLLAGPKAAFTTAVTLQNFNLDGDRGYAWPCWDVSKNTASSLRPTGAGAVTCKAILWDDK